MKAMILAAGFGTRLKPLTATCPKPLVDVGGRPMIAYALDLVRGAGITEVAINLHHLPERIREALGQGEKYGVRITYFEEQPILETGGGIANARGFLEDGDFVVLNADTMTDLPLSDMIAFHRDRHALATMFLRSDPQAQRYGLVEADESRRIRRILGQPEDVVGDFERFMFGGVHVMSPRIFDYLPHAAYSITKVTYPTLLRADEPVFAYVFEGHWQVLDTPEGLAAGRAHVAARGSGSQSST